MRARPRETLKPYEPKSLVFPDGFVLLQDTREQRPLFTRLPKGLVVQSVTLKDGDYSVKGFQNSIVFERKGISDIYPYCSTEREKTIEKMKRLSRMDFAALVIEARESEVFQHQTFTRVHPATVAGAIISFRVRYGVHIFFGNRDSCARYILEHALRYYNIAHEV